MWYKVSSTNIIKKVRVNVPIQVRDFRESDVKFSTKLGGETDLAQKARDTSFPAKFNGGV